MENVVGYWLFTIYGIPVQLHPITSTLCAVYLENYYIKLLFKVNTDSRVKIYKLMCK